MEITSETTCGFLAPGSLTCKEVQHLACNGRCSSHCDYTLAFNANVRRLLMSSMAVFRKDDEFTKLLYEWQDHCIDVHKQPDTREKKTKNGKYKGLFAFTMTMSPHDGLTENQMIFACKKIMEQKSQPVMKFAWYLEYKDPETKQHPHIHGMYELENGRRIEKKHWQRQWSIWDENMPLGAGFRGGYHRAVRLDEPYADYISKQKGIGESHGV